MTAPATQALACPNCGAAIELRTMGHAFTVACASCGSVLDARDPSLAVLQEAQQRAGRVQPLIPLGTRGTLHGDPWEAVGFMQRTITVEGTDYSWREYVLFNPYKGFRYLTEYDGHWNDVITLKTLPTEGRKGSRPVARVHDETFRHFQTARARTTFVLGEFPWEVRVGDTAETRDFIAPPRMLSAEQTGSEVTWSLGTYTPGAKLWQAFKLPGRAPRARGTFANQPSPHTGAGGMLAMFVMLASLLVAMMVLNFSTAERRQVHDRRYSFSPSGTGEPAAFVTDVFELGGRTSNVEIVTEANLNNAWLYLDFALINEETGEARDFGREISYYHGVEDGESWSEGSTRDRAVISSVPPGRWYLRVAQDGDPARGRIDYRLTVTRDVPVGWYYLIGFVLLALPPFWAWIQAASFETSRWAESDYAPDSDD